MNFYSETSFSPEEMEILYLLCKEAARSNREDIIGTMMKLGAFRILDGSSIIKLVDKINGVVELKFSSNIKNAQTLAKLQCNLEYIYDKVLTISYYNADLIYFRGVKDDVLYTSIRENNNNIEVYLFSNEKFFCDSYTNTLASCVSNVYNKSEVVLYLNSLK